MGSRIIQWGWNPVGGARWFDAALTPNDKNKELFEVVWTKPLSTMAPPYDHNYRDAEKLVLTNNDGKKAKFLRVNNNHQYEAEIDSNGNLVNGTVFDIEKQTFRKSIWRLFKVK